MWVESELNRGSKFYFSLLDYCPDPQARPSLNPKAEGESALSEGNIIDEANYDQSHGDGTYDSESHIDASHQDSTDEKARTHN